LDRDKEQRERLEGGRWERNWSWERKKYKEKSKVRKWERNKKKQREMDGELRKDKK
jgi:hypothetical protein